MMTLLGVDKMWEVETFEEQASGCMVLRVYLALALKEISFLFSKTCFYMFYMLLHVSTTMLF